MNNSVEKLPSNYVLFTGKDVYRPNDMLEIKKDHKWLKLNKSSVLVRKKVEIRHEVPVYRRSSRKT
jgi:hypothetical protein